MSEIITIGKGNASVADEQPQQWRSLDEVAGSHDLTAQSDLESPNGRLAADRELHVSRRGFMGVAGFTMAGAAAALSGCIRKPTEHIVPFTSRPEDFIPGKPVYFATAARIGGTVQGLLVESQDGRPTKVDGNPRHPSSGGSTEVLAQASVLDLYDPDCSVAPHQGDTATTWEAWDSWANTHFTGLRRAGGKGLALLLQASASPTMQRLVADFRSAYPQAGVYVHDDTSRTNEAAGADLVGLAGLTPLYDLTKADVIVALDCDFLGRDGDVVANSKDFASGRRISGPSDKMSRLYAVEANFTVTGAMADNRLRLQSGRIGEFLAALAGALSKTGVKASGFSGALSGSGLSEDATAWATAVAADLANAKGKSVVLVGERQPAWVHGLAHLVNSALGNVGTSVAYVSRRDVTGSGDLAALTKALGAGSVSTLVVLGGNPVYAAAGDLDFGAAYARAANRVHLGSHADETAIASTWHLPLSHYLEAWGDHQAPDGTVSVQQPLIAPLHGTRSDIEVLAGIAGAKVTAGHDLIKATWSPGGNGGGAFARNWRKWLHDGVVDGSALPKLAPTVGAAVAAAAPVVGDVKQTGPAQSPATGPAFNWTGLSAALGKRTAVASGGTELCFFPNYALLDGRYANNPWLQELPDPITKLCWDNAALVSPKTARQAGLSNGDMITVTSSAGSATLPAWVTPGLADDTVVLPLGGGRAHAGRFAIHEDSDQAVGFDVNPARSSASPWFVRGEMKRASGTHELATTQHHDRLEPREGWERRPFVRETTIAEYAKKQDYVSKQELMPADTLRSLWTEPNVRTGQQWGMTIDLNTCTGCNTCTVACQAENNISVVGKPRVLKGREMSWIRIDRYFTGEGDNPEAVVQPVACSHCETAPCEGVCPVAATAHSPDGLNDIAYNRCIGTRYCANNCPFKVRRFNFFHYSQENDKTMPLSRLQRNPDVTVRFRGVVEKCTYCVQRINTEKIAAKRDGDGVVPDGRIVPACAQACPVDAIVFGDINDPNSAVSKLKAGPRNYALLSELNIHPRTTYLGKLRNPNPDLA